MGCTTSPSTPLTTVKHGEIEPPCSRFLFIPAFLGRGPQQDLGVATFSTSMPPPAPLSSPPSCSRSNGPAAPASCPPPRFRHQRIRRWPASSEKRKEAILLCRFAKEYQVSPVISLIPMICTSVSN